MALRQALILDEQYDPRSLSKSMQKWFVVEYGMVPAFYILGKHDYFKTALMLQGGFVISSNIFQYRVIDHFHKWNVPKFSGEVQSILGIPVSCLRCPRWLFEFVSQVPNYIHVHQTAVVAGASWATWSPEMQAEFFRRWDVVPGIGYYS